MIFATAELQEKLGKACAVAHCAGQISSAQRSVKRTWQRIL
jgi:hypothetical protein